MEEEFEKEVLQEMTIEALDTDKILNTQPRLGEEDLEGLDKRDKRMVFHAAKLEQQGIEIVEALKVMNHQMRRLEANQIRFTIGWRKVIKWIAGLTVVGILSQVGKWVWKRLFE